MAAGKAASRTTVQSKPAAPAEAAAPTRRAAEPAVAAEERRPVAEPEATAQPAPAPNAAAEAAETVRGSDAGASGREPLRPVDTSVIEGEVVAVHPPHRSLQLSEPPPPEAEPQAKRTSLFDLLRHSTLSTLEGVAQAAMEAFASSRAGKTASAVPGVDRAAALGAGVASAATPVFETARALLPPAIGAARTLASAVASGRAFSEAAGTAVDAASALHQAASRAEPSMLEFDLFGEDPALSSRLEPILDFLHDRYFRVEVFGAGDVPTGPCLIVCNHAGVLPLDGPMMRTVLRRECGRADARWLVEDSIFHAPFVGDLLNRLGAVRACPENAERLLAQRTAVVVFPEGVLGSGKTVRERYRLQRFGRGGFVKLALRAGVPIVPAAILGAEDTQPLLGKVGSLPITPTFPWLGPVGLLPLPSKWTISFLPPVDVRAHGAAAADDLALVGRITEEVRGTIQGEIDRLLAERETTR
jgi:1-acyl-sn-glycerol-3-phosphate acyltransferase